MVVYLDNIIKFNKNSSSPTNIYFADLVRDDQSKTPVAIKAFIKLDINFYNQLRESKIIKKVLTEEEINKGESNLDKYNIKIYGLDYEVGIYKKVKELIDAKNTPNFIEYEGYREYGLLEFMQKVVVGSKKFSTDELKEFIGEIKGLTLLTLINNKGVNKIIDYYDILYKNITVCCLVTKVPDNVTTLYDLFSEKISGTEIYQIFFQLMYNLKLMEKIKLIHNDLHTRNILIERLSLEKTIYYKVGNKNYKLRTKYIVKIFDFDFSYYPPNGENRKINEFNDIGVYNEFTEKFDLFTLLCMLNGMCRDITDKYTFCLSKIIINLLPTALKNNIIEISKNNYTFIKSFDEGGKFVTYDGFYCRANNRDNLKYLDNLDDILDNYIFDIFVTNDTYYDYIMPT